MKRPNVLNLTCPAIPVVRIGFVGLGNRGILALERYMHLEGIEVKALCDLRKENIERAEHILREFGRPEAELFGRRDVAQDVRMQGDRPHLYLYGLADSY